MNALEPSALPRSWAARTRRWEAGLLAIGTLLPTLGACGSSAGAGGSCGAGDQNGQNGGQFTLELTVSDTAFTPILLKAENAAQVTLSLHNSGSVAHDFVVECMPTPNFTGCPPTTCFPTGAAIAAVAPGGTGSATFVTPNAEGIYAFRSDVGADSTVPGDGGVSGLTGQFIVQ